MIRILVGDSLERLAELPDESVDAVVTDPPYGLGKEPPIADVLHAWLAGQQYHAKGSGFMGREWDAYVPGPHLWRECLRVLRPGGHMVAFFGTRTYDVGTMAIRIAGFEIRDQLAWLYGSGFPKSLDVSKAIDAMYGAEREQGEILKGASSQRTESLGRHTATYAATYAATDEAKQWDGWGTALKPAQEPIVLARKPLAGTVAETVLEHGTGGLNVDGCRVAHDDDVDLAELIHCQTEQSGDTLTINIPGFVGAKYKPGGRWPANVVHDGSDEVLAGFPVTKAGSQPSVRAGMGFGGGAMGQRLDGYATDAGSAARFFYCSKASKADRDEGLDGFEIRSPGEKTDREDGSDGIGPRAGARAEGRNHHPTVKPTELMRWLCRLITPPGGTVLDPFLGSGSTGKAAALEGFSFIGCELDPEYATLAEARIRAVARVDESEAGEALAKAGKTAGDGPAQQRLF